MALPSVDYQGAIVADLPRGRIETRDHQRLVAIPADWFEALVTRAPADAAMALGATLGATLETDVRAALPTAGEPAPEDVAYALSAALALRGFGLAAFERWGDALALIWRDPPGTGEAFGEIAAATIAALLQRITGLEVRAVPVGTAQGELRILFGSAQVCEMARQRARAGESLQQIVAHLERAPEGA